MTFRESMLIVFTFGRFKGQTVHQVGSTDEGLKYMDWLMGCDWFKQRTEFHAVSTYLASPGVASRLNQLLED